jgi:hypothetical protein
MLPALLQKLLPTRCNLAFGLEHVSKGLHPQRVQPFFVSGELIT